MDSENLSLKVTKYIIYLHDEERSENTVTKYARDLRAFFAFIRATSQVPCLHEHLATAAITSETRRACFVEFGGGDEITKTAVLEWKDKLTKEYAPASVNSMLAALNGFFDWLDLPQLKVKPLKIQREIFAKPEKELTKQEYDRLIRAAQAKHNERLALLLQTICATGIRVSELPFITVEAVHTGRAAVDCKGKSRTVFLPKELCKSIIRYCKEQKITGGLVFRTASGKAIDRSNIWRDMKALCKSAGVEQSKVFPHNLRHLFARTYYSIEKDIARLADLLGHSNITTTRIYMMETGKEHLRQLERMGLVLAKKE